MSQSKLAMVFLSATLLMTGAGCMNTVAPAVDDAISAATVDEIDLGFTASETSSSGKFITFKNGGTYSGSFENDESVYYVATIPPAPRETGRGATYSDSLGYRKNADGTYSLHFLGQHWNPITDEMARVIGEVDLKLGQALILTGPIQCGGPGCLTGPDSYIAYINTPNGPLPGGAFATMPGVALGDFKAVLGRVSIK